MYRYRLLTMAHVCFGDQTLNVVSKTPKLEFLKLPCTALLTQPCVLWCSLGKSKSSLGECPAGTGIPEPPCRQPLHPFPLAPHTSVQYSHMEPNNESFVASRNGMKTAFLQVQSFQKASWKNPWSLSGSSCGSRLEITLKLETWNKNLNHCTC